MTTKDLEKLKKFYEESKKLHGLGTSESLHWNSKESQQARFKVLKDIGDLNNKSILDLGCGYGDFLLYLYSQNIRSKNYTGIDIDSDFINTAKTKFLESEDIKFVELNFMNSNFEEADYVFCSGGLNLQMEDYQSELERIIKKMFEKSKIALGFNLLRAGVHNTDETFMPNDPEKIKAYCLKLTPNVKVVLDYVPHDFTIFMYKKS